MPRLDANFKFTFASAFGFVFDSFIHVYIVYKDSLRPLAAKSSVFNGINGPDGGYMIAYTLGFNASSQKGCHMNRQP